MYFQQIFIKNNLHQNIKQNTAAAAIKRYSGVFDIAKAGKADRHPGHRDTPGIYKQSSFDNLTRNEVEKAVSRDPGPPLPRDRHEGEGLTSSLDYNLNLSNSKCFP